MLTILLIILLILLVIYLYYQNRQLKTNGNSSTGSFANEPKSLFELDEDLIAERDLAIRQRNETEAENLSLSNKLKLKHQEISRKESEIERLKKEASQKEIALNGKIKELKEKYSKQSQLLDTEQLENNKLTEQVEKLEAEIKQLKGNLPGSFPGGEDD